LQVLLSLRNNLLGGSSSPGRILRIHIRMLIALVDPALVLVSDVLFAPVSLCLDNLMLTDYFSPDSREGSGRAHRPFPLPK